MTFTPNLPPIRRLLRPDPGYCLIDCDLDRADVHAVAWDSGARALKDVLRSGTDLHTANAELVWGSSNPTRRQMAKAGCHAVNYGCRERTLAITLGITVMEAEDFIRRWFAANPEIPRWHRRIESELRFKRQVRNAWGFRRFYFDMRLRGQNSNLQQILQQALAWIGQSTVSITINRAMLNIHRLLPEFQLLLQIHDSLLGQAPIELCPAIFPRLLELMRVEVPYEDPLIIPSSLKYSTASWGEVQKWKPGDDFRLAA